MADLAGAVSTLFEQGSAAPRDAARDAFLRLRGELAAGRVRAAEPDAAAAGGWRVNLWVMQGVRLGLRVGEIVEMGVAKGRWPFFDYDTMPLKSFAGSRRLRVAPGGSSVREGAYLGDGVVCMPPMYINIGAYVDDGALIDSHALVGAGAQVGKRAHLGAGTQIGSGVEPAGGLPVVVEDDVVIGPGTILTGASPIYDLPNARILAAGPGQPLVVPRGAVVVPGARAVTTGAGREWGLSLATPVIVAYRDGTTDVRTELQRWIT